MTSSIAALALGVAGSVVPVRRIQPPVMVAAIAAVALASGFVPAAALGDALAALAAPLAFLLFAVPLAVVLDELGFFAGVAALVDGGRHLRLGLWVAAAVTVLFNLDAAVVLLTPLYVRIAACRAGGDRCRRRRVVRPPGHVPRDGMDARRLHRR